MHNDLKLCTVGIRYLDEQHDSLLSLMLELECLLQQNGRSRELCDTLLKVINFAEVHFYAEELLMESIGFSAIEAHRAEHKKIALRLDRFRFQLSGTDSKRSEELLNLLYTWIEQHVREWDCEYGRFFASRRECLPGKALGDPTFGGRATQPESATNLLS